MKKRLYNYVRVRCCAKACTDTATIEYASAAGKFFCPAHASLYVDAMSHYANPAARGQFVWPAGNVRSIEDLVLHQEVRYGHA